MLGRVAYKCGKHTRKMLAYKNIARFLSLHTLPDNKILDSFKFKALQTTISTNQESRYFFCGKIENILGKGETAVLQLFLLFPLCFLTRNIDC